MIDSILSWLILIPVIGVLLILITCRSREESCILGKYIALTVSMINLILALIVLKNFDHTIVTFQMVEKGYFWADSINLSIVLGVDGISVYFILLTALLIPICIVSSWHSIKMRMKEFLIAFLLLEALVIGSFLALDLLLFYFFFEALLIPMYLIIGIWGAEDRIYAAFKFFLYTLAGSLLFLLAIIYIYIKAGTFDIITLYKIVPTFSIDVQILLWLAFFASFAVKVPMFPFHTWLPDAHVQAPTAGSVILAGVLLKLGGYGFIRFSLPMLPEASHHFQTMMFVLSGIAVVYASFVALAQNNIKKLIAYSSIAHMGFVTIGIFSFNVEGINGAIFQMISHGVVSAALFLIVGVLYDQMHTKEIAHYGGVTEKMPIFAVFSLFFFMASIGLPGTSGFIGETLVLLATFMVNKYCAAICATGVILGAAYMLWLYKRVFFGAIVNEEVNILKDVGLRDASYFIVLLLITLLLGIYPMIVINNTNESVLSLIDAITRNGKL